MKKLWWLCFTVILATAFFAPSDAVGWPCAVGAGVMVYGRLPWGRP